MTCSPRVPADFVDDAGHLSYLSVYMRSLESRAFVAALFQLTTQHLSGRLKSQESFQTLSTSTNRCVKVAKNETTWNNDVWISVIPFVFSGRWMTTIPWPSHQQLHLSGTFRSVVHQLPQVEDFQRWDLDGYTHTHPNERNSLPFLKGNESSSKPSDFHLDGYPVSLLFFRGFLPKRFASGALTIWKYSWQHANNEAPIEYRPQCDDRNKPTDYHQKCKISSEKAPNKNTTWIIHIN